MVLQALFRFLNIFRCLFAPFAVGLAWPFSSRVRERLRQERHWSSLSGDAQILTHTSSEGELEQVWPLLESFLKRRDSSFRIQILFTSASLESKIEALMRRYPGRIDARMLPLLHYPWGLCWAGGSLKRWTAAPLRVMVRYDFFPELVLALSCGGRLGLLSATFKGKEQALKGGLGRWYWRSLMSQFDFIFCSTQKDLSLLENLLAPSSREGRSKRPKLFCFEFRVMQILARLEKARERLEKHSWFVHLKAFFETYPPSRRLILGSAWEVDLDVFADPTFRQAIARGEWGVVIAPHQLSRVPFERLCRRLLEVFNERGGNTDSVAIWREKNTSPWEGHPVIVTQIPAVLCEMYSLFGHAYVGGGFGRSVHSLLEPFWAGAHLYCGPRLQRSTEYDLICEEAPEKIYVLNTPRDLFPNLHRDSSENLAGTSLQMPELRGRYLRKGKAHLKALLTEALPC